MNMELEQYRDEELLKCAQIALKQWKWAESYYDDKDLKENQEYIEILKKRYLSLLMEIRKRNLSLTSQQLLKAILLNVIYKKE